MSYDYYKFVHPVPGGFVIPKDTQVRRVDHNSHHTDTFFITLGELEVPSSSTKTYYLDRDIAVPKTPIKINSVIYNVRVGKDVFPVAVHRGSHMWSAFFKHGGRKTIYSPEIESFDTTPPSDDRYAANEAKQREAAES